MAAEKQVSSTSTAAAIESPKLSRSSFFLLVLIWPLFSLACMRQQAAADWVYFFASSSFIAAAAAAPTTDAAGHVVDTLSIH